MLFNKTTYGKNIYAIRGNAEAARVSGVNVSRTLIIVYNIAGLLYGLGGSLEAAHTGGATNTIPTVIKMWLCFLTGNRIAQ
ncbi:MAG: hypothetical protein LBB98_07925 [Treponema sp.]|nr:hypothetical protein [Treponema sp.]